MGTDGLQTEGAAVGRTLGVEEEFHLVDPGTLALTPGPRASAAALAGEAGARVHPEISTTQLEIATGVCTTLAQVRAELVAARAEAAAAAARDGLLLLAASTHPWSSWHTMPVTPGERYEAMVGRWAGLARQQDICGCHVHVGVPDLDTAVAVLDRARPYLPVLLAMTGSSPFHDGVDTGYESWRTLWWTRFPHAGAPEPLGDADGYRRVLAGLVASGVVADGSHLYWDVRPSARLPTIEFRLADVCTTLDDAVLHAALVRSLVRVLAARAARGEPAPEVRPELLRAARWRAARSGLSAPLFDPLRGELVDPREAVGALLAELADDLADAGEEDEVRALVQDLLDRGTSAARQRSTWLRTGDRRAVAEQVVREGAAGRT
ncbi:carboxylate-amine ligase [Geodermatophilus telluris]|uniref:Putative glutamate--cysteine ligase 2 n=1 Tax=Geodermatophilus telluris TaxID=1190417 RepID=A0A1G6PJ20_9ACTN|nr:glutamate--cysteine ligase [Geodermatophilus telluris]SDC80058.1 carboxylate-amine ligase [Geodermatophilus telluris]